MLRPLVVALLAFLAGLLPALRFAPEPHLLILAAVGLLGASVLAPGRSGAPLRARGAERLLFLAYVAVGASAGAAAAVAAASDCRTRIPDGARVRVVGFLGSASLPPTAAADGPPRTPLLPLEHAGIRVDGGICRGAVRMRLPEGAPMPAGSRVEAVGEWVRFRRPVVLSSWPADPARSGFVVAETTLEAAPARPLPHPLLWARGRAEWRLLELFPRHFGVVDALLLGRRERMDEEVRERFTASGLAHLLAISGMHVGLLAGVFMVVGAALRLPRARVSEVTIALTWLYLGLIGAPTSGVRAGVMITLALLAERLQRPSAGPPMIAAAALVILALTPTAVLQPGFQLSFAGVLGIVVGNRLLGRTLRERVRAPAPRAVAEAVLVSAAAFVATAPITIHHFGSFAPIAVLANLPAIPLTGLAVTGVAAALAAAPVALPLARLLADGAGAALDLLDGVARVAGEVPMGHASLPRPGVVVWLAAALGCAVAMALVRARPLFRGLIAGGAAGAFLLASPLAGGGSERPLEIHFLDVGQGDAVAIRSPAGRWLLLDAGPRTQNFDAGERRVLPFLRARGVRKLEALVLTHPDADHIGGAAAVLRGMEVARLVEPGLPVGKELYLELLEEAEERGVVWIAARAGRVMTLDGMELRFLWPDAAALDSLPEANHISAVVQLRYGEFSAILPGDAHAEAEGVLATRHGSALRSQVLKAGHHGSRTSTSEPFLAAVAPQLAVISAGQRNRYGHPAPEVVQRLQRHGVEIARTDREGTVSLLVEGRDPAVWWRVEP